MGGEGEIPVSQGDSRTSSKSSLLDQDRPEKGPFGLQIGGEALLAQDFLDALAGSSLGVRVFAWHMG